VATGPDTQAECAARRDVFSGATLIAGALVFVVVMALHPTAHEILEADDVAHFAHLNRHVHSMALAGVPIAFLGLLGLWRRLGGGPLATAGLVTWGFASVAVTSAAIASGFVATEAILADIRKPDHPADLSHLLLDYTSWINQGFAKVYFVAGSIAIVVWAVAILRGGRMHRAAGVGGLIAGGGALFLGGHLRLDVHGFGILVLLQASWMVWVGVLLCRPGRLESGVG